MTEFRPQYVEQGCEIRPLISIVCNFTKPTDRQPSLLTFNEVTTLLHEFGHALHGMLACGRYPALTGTNVYRDFVELPSQLMENWATEKEFLDLWAVHYRTGEKIPADLVQKIVDAKNFQAAYLHIRQVSFGLSDMAWHTVTAPVEGGVAEFERRAIGKAQLLPYVAGQCMATAFGHIFRAVMRRVTTVTNGRKFSMPTLSRFSGSGVFSIRTWRKHSGRISWKREAQSIR